MDGTMLILNRRKGQSVDIEGCIVTVLQINGGSVKLGLTGPVGVRIVRSELLSKQEKENGSDTTEKKVGQPNTRKSD